jgi:hypothetical protein
MCSLSLFLESAPPIFNYYVREIMHSHNFSKIILSGRYLPKENKKMKLNTINDTLFGKVRT